MPDTDKGTPVERRLAPPERHEAAPQRAPAILFGDIAIAERFITHEQLDEALRAQESQEKPESIGEILLRKGDLRPAQLRRVLEIQATRLSVLHEATQRSLEESLFGKVVVMLEMATESQVNAAIREQAHRLARGEPARLGQILVDAGILTVDQVLRVLHRQEKEVLFCPSCYVQYNILGYDSGMTFRCRNCGRDLKVPAPGEASPVDPRTVVYDMGKPTVRVRTGAAPDDAPAPPSPGSGELKAATFGNYRIIRKIARGGMGIVYQALQMDLDRVVALKVLTAGTGASAEDLRRFHLEASAAANLNHPFIVPIHEVGEIDGRHYFTMDFVKGRTLAEMRRDDGLSIRNALIVTSRVAEALHYAHTQGIVHRDVKPANIIVDQFDNPRITDFGIVKDLLSDTKRTETGLLMGTPAYMSPEQAGGLKEIDGRADVYSLGAVLYELLTGRPPFPGESSMDVLMKVMKSEPPSPKTLNPTIHKDVGTICMKCLEKDPGRRYASAADLQDDIERYLNGETIRARPVPWWERLWRRILRNKTASITIAVAFILVCTAVGIAIGAKVNAQKENLRKVRAYIEHARDYLNEGEIEAAKEEFTKALAIDAGNRDARAGLDDADRGLLRRRDELVRDGWNLLRYGKYEAAEQRFVDALELERDSKDAHKGLDAVKALLVERGKTEELLQESEALMRKGLDLAGEAAEDNPDRAARKYVRAVILLRQAAAMDPERDSAESKTRQALFDVLLDFARVAIRRRTFDMASFLLSEASFLRGDRDRLQALQNTLEKEMRQYKGYTEYLGQARESLADGDFDAAIPAIRQALEIAETEEAKATLAQALYQKGIREGDAKAAEKLWEDALVAYDLALENAIDPDRAAVQARCTKAREEICSPLLAGAKGLWAEGETEEAGGLLRKVLEVDPTHQLARRMLADLKRTDEAPEGTVYIPGGMFAPASSRSGRKWFIVSFYIDRHEVTNREYAAFVADRGYERPDLWDAEARDAIAEFVSPDGVPAPLGWIGGSFPEGTADHPVSGVSWYEARAYARWKGGRLPTEWEWEKAASEDGVGRRKYPWGESWDPSLENLGSGRVRPAGETDRDESPFGVRDLGGNVSEWAVGSGLTPIVKGGSYLVPLERYARCSFRGTPPPRYRTAGTGFRCVHDIGWNGKR